MDEKHESLAIITANRCLMTVEDAKLIWRVVPDDGFHWDHMEQIVEASVVGMSPDEIAKVYADNSSPGGFPLNVHIKAMRLARLWDWGIPFDLDNL